MMQSQLGLLPQQSGQMPLGVPLTQAPPPPPVISPGQMSQMLHDAGMARMQQTIQMASPQAAGAGYTWGGTMANLGAQQMNPYFANALGGGGMSLPPPPMDVRYGGYRPTTGRGGPGFSPMPAPSVYNPYTQFPSSQFQTQQQHHAAVLNAVQARGSAMALGAVQGAAEMAGGSMGMMAGAAMGSMFGPVGTVLGGALGMMGGDWMGGHIGGAMTGPVLNDLTRGRQIQNMTSPFMVGGSNLNQLTGQGFNRQAGLQTAISIRDITRDHNFTRQTGFNQQDMMRMTELSSEQGLLDTARNPEEISRRMRDIAKSVKALIQITHDPDVRAAIADLGKLRTMGFEGQAGGMTAAVNRASFARMAGMSSAAVGEQYGMPGAMAAQGLGLAGSTGYMAGVSGAGLANAAISSGSFSDLQLSRAGGRAGIAQTNMMASLGAANQDIYMAASLTKGADGKITVDPAAYQRAQGMDISAVAQQGRRRLDALGAQGISDLSTRKQEFKDILSASQSPAQQSLNVLRQAQSMQRETGLTLGGAFNVMVGSTEEGRGMSGEQRGQIARTLELQYSNPEYYKTLEQQRTVDLQDSRNRQRARLAEHRTPGILSQIGRGAQDIFYGASDMVTSPVRGLVNSYDEAQADIAAQRMGVQRYSFSDTERVHNKRERELVLERNDPAALQALISAGAKAADAGGGIGNFLTSSVGLTAWDHGNLVSRTAAQGRGDIFGRSAAEDSAYTSSVQQASLAVNRADKLDDTTRKAIIQKASGDSGIDIARLSAKAADALEHIVPKNATSDSAVTDAHLVSAMHQAGKEMGLDENAIQKLLNNKEQRAMVMTSTVDRAKRFGSDKLQGSLSAASEIALRLGGDSATSAEGVHKIVARGISAAAGFGMGKTHGISVEFSKDEREAFQTTLGGMSADATEMAALKQRALTDPEAAKKVDELRARLGDKADAVEEEATKALKTGGEVIQRAFSVMGRQADLHASATTAHNLAIDEKKYNTYRLQEGQKAAGNPTIADGDDTGSEAFVGDYNSKEAAVIQKDLTDLRAARKKAEGDSPQTKAFMDATITFTEAAEMFLKGVRQDAINKGRD